MGGIFNPIANGIGFQSAQASQLTPFGFAAGFINGPAPGMLNIGSNGISSALAGPQLNDPFSVINRMGAATPFAPAIGLFGNPTGANMSPVAPGLNLAAFSPQAGLVSPLGAGAMPGANGFGLNNMAGFPASAMNPLMGTSPMAMAAMSGMPGMRELMAPPQFDAQNWFMQGAQAASMWFQQMMANAMRTFSGVSGMGGAGMAVGAGPMAMMGGNPFSASGGMGMPAGLNPGGFTPVPGAQPQLAQMPDGSPVYLMPVVPNGSMSTLSPGGMPGGLSGAGPAGFGGMNPMMSGMNPMAMGSPAMMAGMNPMMSGINPMAMGSPAMMAGMNPMMSGMNSMAMGSPAMMAGMNPIMSGINPMAMGSPAMMAGMNPMMMGGMSGMGAGAANFGFNPQNPFGGVGMLGAGMMPPNMMNNPFGQVTQQDLARVLSSTPGAFAPNSQLPPWMNSLQVPPQLANHPIVQQFMAARNATGMGGVLVSPLGTYMTSIGPSGGTANAGLLGTQSSGSGVAMVLNPLNPSMIVSIASAEYSRTNFNRGYFSA